MAARLTLVFCALVTVPMCLGADLAGLAGVKTFGGTSHSASGERVPLPVNVDYVCSFLMVHMHHTSLRCRWTLE